VVQVVDFPVAVEARFAEDGTITPLVVILHGQRYPIADVGRRWSDEQLRHYLVMTPLGGRFELCLDTRALRWRVVRTWERGFIA
jgi:hypothetical protein